jgi:hypothetical protein
MLRVATMRLESGAELGGDCNNPRPSASCGDDDDDDGDD